MISMAFVLLVIAIIAGVLGFGIANVVAHIAKFLFYVVILFLLLLGIYFYTSLRTKNEPVQPVIETPATEIKGAD
ncbi:MAG: DUF1328 domain-containing protein [Parachlamydiaceae bacterium]|nr:DUF1328 domain-containing protein [Parachlamydiaceae bacterium]